MREWIHREKPSKHPEDDMKDSTDLMEEVVHWFREEGILTKEQAAEWLRKMGRDGEEPS